MYLSFIKALVTTLIKASLQSSTTFFNQNRPQWHTHPQLNSTQELQKRQRCRERMVRGNRCWECGPVDTSDGVTPLHSRVSLVDLYECWSHSAAEQAHTHTHTEVGHTHAPWRNWQICVCVQGCVQSWSTWVEKWDGSCKVGPEPEASRRKRESVRKRAEVANQKKSHVLKVDQQKLGQQHSLMSSYPFTCACCNKKNTVKVSVAAE